MNSVRLNNYEKSDKKISKMDKIIINLYSLYFVLYPFYLWTSGLPQLADILLLITILLYVVKNRLSIPINKESKPFLYFTALFILWIFLVSFVWIIQLSIIDSFLRSSLFYLYNFIVLLFSSSLITKYKDTLLRKILKMFMLSVIIQVILILFGGAIGGERLTGTFNNPNQLGFYAILFTGFYIFFYNRYRFNLKILALGFIMSGFLVLVSLSNGAIISWVFMVSIFLIKYRNDEKWRIVIPLLFIILFVIYIYNSSDIIQQNQFYQTLVRRLSGTQHKIEESTQVRGYYRIFEYPEYWVFGAGEGAFERFGQNIEFHSTIGNIQVSYGIVGSILFAILNIFALKNNQYALTYVVISFYMYGYSHNGVRNTLFWIFLSLLATTNIKK